MLLSPSHLAILVSLPLSSTSPVSLSLSATRLGSALHLPLARREVITSTPWRVPQQGTIGLGDYIDVCVLSGLTTTARSLRNQDIQCSSASRRDSCTARSRYALLLFDNVYLFTVLSSQTPALPISGCSLALALQTASSRLFHCILRLPFSQAALVFVWSMVTH